MKVFSEGKTLMVLFIAFQTAVTMLVERTKTCNHAISMRCYNISGEMTIKVSILIAFFFLKMLLNVWSTYNSALLEKCY